MSHCADLLAKYILAFGDLHRNRGRGGYAPHKPLLLLSILDEVRLGHMSANLVAMTPELVATFRAYWRALVPDGQWQERIVYPFRYLVRDGFWELVRNGVPISPAQLGDPTSIRQLRALVDGGRFAPDLWQLLQDRVAINTLRAHLLATYFGMDADRVQPAMPVSPMDYEAARLVAEAEARFRPRVVRETVDSDGYYVRHALFPTVIRSLYDNSCAVCGISARSDDGHSIVDAAHIMPFSRFHNDDPRNGIALCKNHHWAFDAGWFSVGDDRRVLVSPRLRCVDGFLTPGVLLRPPVDGACAPAAEALRWHRENAWGCTGPDNGFTIACRDEGDPA